MRYTEIIEDLRSAPFVRLFLPLALGVTFQVQLFQVKPSITPVCLALLFVLIATHKLNLSYSRRWCFGVVLYLFLFFTGIALVQNIKTESDYPVGRSIYVEAVVNDAPVKGDRFTKLNVLASAYSDSLNTWRKVEEKMIFYLRIDSSKVAPRMGDKILTRLTLSPLPAAKNPYEFDYGAYLKQRQIFSSAFINSDSYVIISSGNTPLWRVFPTAVSSYLLNYFSKQGLQGDELAVLQALTIGDKSLLNSDLKQLYMDTGAMHILAVSGMHVGIISMILGWLLVFMKKQKYGILLRGLLILVFIWLYAVVAGLSPSILRATIMFSIVTIGGMLNRHTNTYNSLTFSAFLICALDPYSLFDAGFQLSYAAVISIVFFYPYIYHCLNFRRWLPDALWSLVAVAIAANIGTLPVAVYLFHQLPVHFILTNVLSTLPTMAAMGGFLATLIFVHFPISQVGWFCANFTGYSIKALNGSIRFVEGLPYARIEALWLTSLQAWLLMLSIVMLALFIWTRKTKLVLLALTLFSACLCLRIATKYEQAHQKMLTVYSVKNASLITLVNGRAGFALCDSADLSNTFDFNVKNHMVSLGFAGLKSLERIALQDIGSEKFQHYNVYKNFINFAERTVKILHDEKLHNPHQPLPVDYLILTSQCKLKPEQVLAMYHPQLFIIDASVSAREVARFKRVLTTHGLPFHNVRENGAFIQNF